MKIPNGTLITFLKQILEIEPNSKIRISHLSEYASGKRRPSRRRSKIFEEASGISAEIWMFEKPNKIKDALIEKFS